MKRNMGLADRIRAGIVKIIFSFTEQISGATGIVAGAVILAARGLVGFARFIGHLEWSPSAPELKVTFVTVQAPDPLQFCTVNRNQNERKAI